MNPWTLASLTLFLITLVLELYGLWLVVGFLNQYRDAFVRYRGLPRRSYAQLSEVGGLVEMLLEERANGQRAAIVLGAGITIGFVGNAVSLFA